MRKKILFVSHYFEEHRGGVEIVVSQIVHHLQSESFSVTWAAIEILPSSLTREVSVDGVIREKLRGSNFIEDKIGIAYPFCSFASALRLISLVRKSDIVHVHEYWYITNLIAIFCAFIFRKPIVLTQHISAVATKNIFVRTVHSFFNNVLSPFLFSRIDQTLFISEKVRDFFVQKGKFKRPPIYLPNGVDRSKFKIFTELEIKELRTFHQMDPKTFVILFVGRFVERKGIHLIQRWIPQFPEIRWIMIGWGGVQPEQWGFKNLMVKHFLDHTEIPLWYAMADLVILPSYGEGFPLVVQEALSCGTRVLTSEETAMGCTGIRDLLYTAPLTGFHAAADPWVRQMRQISSDIPPSSKLKECHLNQLWDWNQNIQMQREIYLKISAK